jgi:hypothetical protein
MMAIKPPAKEGEHHPAPWIRLLDMFGWGKAGSEETVETQLHVPPLAGGTISAWDVAGWIVLLIRMKSDAWPEMRLMSDKQFSDCASSDRVSLFGEVGRRFGRQHTDLTNVLEWVRLHWYPSMHLLEDKDFRFVAEVMFTALPRGNGDVSLVMAWAALERLFSRSHTEITFRISAYIASFLEERGPARLSLQKEIARLYGDRSTVAHGSDLKNGQAYGRTNEIAHSVMVKIVELRSVPTRDDLDSLLFT